MNRVTNFFLISIFIFALINFISNDISNEIEDQYLSSNNLPTNTTIFKENVDLKISKIIAKDDTKESNEKILIKEEEFRSNFILNLDKELVQLNKELRFLIKQNQYAEFSDRHGGIKGIYLNGYHFNNKNKMDLIESVFKNTNVNTLVIDIKTDNGHVLFETNNPLAIEMNNVRSKYNKASLEEFKNDKNLYLIGRVVVFQDPLFAKKYPEEAVFDTAKNTIYSQDGQYFIDPSSKKAQNYIIDISKEACELGFDEIQFDYIRYPDSSYQYMKFKDESTFENRIKNINSFLSLAKPEINSLGCLLSADVFGFILTNKFDGGIGQNLETMIENLDFISPMVYPSHYNSGSFGFSNPNRNPYGVISAALQDALDRDVQPYKLRPFLQGFWHTDFEVRENIRAAEDKDLGWLIWNVSSSYNLEYFSKIDS